MTTRHILRPKYNQLYTDVDVGRHNVERLFCDLLSVRDCEWGDLIKELQNLKNQGYPDLEKTTQLYEYLMTLARSLKTRELEALRNVFENEELIYTPLRRGADQKWHHVRGCLWSRSAKVRGKVILNEHYERLESFFIDVLGVETAKVELVHDELIRLGSSSDASAVDVRDRITSLNSILVDMDFADYPDATMLIEANILPIRKPDQTVSLASAKTDFVIIDRAHLGEIFAPQVRTLDFSVEEVRRLDPFIKLLRQDRKRLSEVVREVTAVDEGDKQPLQCRQRQIGPKAHALYRVAFHLNSPRLKPDGHALYNMLRNAQVYTTEGITSELHLSQDGEDHCYVTERSDLHIRESGSQLEIFVSRNQKKQGFCYSSKLNERLFQWLMTDPLTHMSETLDSRGLLTVHKIINSRRSVLAQILDEDGIVTGDIEELDQEVESNYDSDEEESDDNWSSDLPTTPSVQRTAPSRSEYSPNHKKALSRNSWFDGVEVSPQASSDRNTKPPLHQTPTSPVACRSLKASETGEAERLQYADLLSRVVSAARRSRFPAKSSFDMSRMSSALPVFYGAADSYDAFHESHLFHTTSKLERDKKIAAAGELYVFELLKSLGLPNFSMRQWRSTIRHYAAAHPDYADTKEWSGRESSDITYVDVKGEFTRLLIDTGHLDGEVWRHERPMYFLKVKATTGPCDTPFSVSKGQYERVCLSICTILSSNQHLILSTVLLPNHRIY
ncbi:hypothetical protein INS49_002409 [Diaporthe citri]|uniref:uncharacterized protein n=1 Tax=Diaporthe citri TaxID=83186 RepID=UPI001C8042FA|nr:uncharacterized protein INS49_002409 [Diaporthe citri]KAG6368208.1 hypothetical protein INS49_002409 [Diaporthe citri]